MKHHWGRCRLIASDRSPTTDGHRSRLTALLISAISRARLCTAHGSCSEGGKLVFGKKRIRLEKPTAFSWTRPADDADFDVGRGKECVERLFRARKRSITVALSKRENCRAGNLPTLFCPFTTTVSKLVRRISNSTSWIEISGTANEIEIPAKRWAEAI